MSLDALLARLHAAGIRLRRDGGELAVGGSREKLDAALVGEMRAHKAALLEMVGDAGGAWWSPPAIRPEMLTLVELSQAEIDRVVAGVPGGARNVQDIYPLAPLQEGILFHHLLASRGDPYLLTSLLSFDTRDRVDAYLAALQAVIDRHDILRTAVAWEGLREPVQVVWRRASLPVDEVTADGGDAARLLLARFDPRHHRLDVREAPLLRAHLARDAATGRWMLLLLLHHLAGDHTTLDLLRAEVQAHLSGHADRLPAPLPFRNLVAQARLGVSRAEHERFFRALLADVDEPTAPFGFLDARGGDVEIAESRREVDAALAARLRERARRMGVTVAALCHVAWAMILARVSGREDVVFGTVLFGRMQGGAGADRVMGPAINTLPVRLRVGAEGAEACVRRMQALLGELLRHEHASLALAQRCSGVQAPAPLFSSLLNHRHGAGARAPATDAPPASDGVRGLHAEERTNYPFTVSVDDLGDGGFRLTAQVPATVGPARVCGMMHAALDALAAALQSAPDAPVALLDVLSEEERAQVLDAWNATDRAFPAGVCVHDLFAAQAARTPDAAAVSWRGERTTYAELDARSNRLAHAMRCRGVGPESRVGICLPRTPDLVVSLLAVLKAGGAYVPLDPSYPRERLAGMVEDAGISVVLTSSSLLDRLPESGAETLILDHASAEIDSEPSHAPESGVGPENLSHVIFTSGSTGRPKGVMIRHASVVVLLHWLRENVSDDERWGMLFSTSISFDVSVAEVFGTLCWGGMLIVAENALDLPTVPEEVVYASMVPSAAAELLRGGGIPASVRTLNLGGEALPTPLAQGLYALETVERVGNLYGPTEDTTYSTYAAVPRGGEVTLGRPVANTRAYVLDGRLQPVPSGVVGELYLSGDGLSRGYANRPGLTAERFLPNPFGPAGSRMYRVMDRVRHRADGELEYLGRIDFQVKVRGYRIEPGEIEVRLAEHPAVREAVVLARESAAGDRRLVAYVVGDEEASAESLRAHLSERLPAYMVPAAYVRLEAWPRTPNGKIDRRALPAPEGDAFLSRPYEAPEGETETALAEIWSALLGVERVGRHDHFFELGGHSLLAVQVISRIRQALEVDVALGDLFARPVLADLARGMARAAPSHLPPIVAGERGERLALSFAQQRLWFLEQLGGLGAAYHMPAALRLKGEMDRDALVRALDRIVARHEALRTTFVAMDGEAEQRIASAEESRFHLLTHDLSAHPAAEAELRRVRAEEAAAPFDLARGPLVRGRLVRLSGDDHVLLVTMHHVVSDGWSMGVFTRELGALYGAFHRGEPDPLPPLPVQYADYATWQRRVVVGDELERQAGFWKATLAGAPELLEVPADRERPAEQDVSGAAAEVVLDEALTAALKALSARHGATLFMTLLAGWAAVLSRLSGQADVVIGTPSANRGRAEVEGLIGFFVNTLALRIDLTGTPTVADLLARVKAATLAAQDHQDIPFEQVVERVQPVRSLAHTPLFQAVLVWQNTPRETLSLPGLTLEPVGGAGHVASPFDLSLTLREAGGRIVGGVEYATALFDAATVDRYVDYLRRVLAEMATADGREVGRLPLMSDAERRQVVDGWSAAGGDEHPAACIHAGFEARAARTPAAVAVIDGDRALTYAELNAWANRVAHRLRGVGVRPGARVAVCMERSPEMVAALLGVLKAGAAYVPLDPAHPAERLRTMLDDCAPAALLAPGAALADVALPRVDPASAEVAREAETNPALPVGAEHLAYVLYTSGSTGTPKGVMVEHGAVTRQLAAVREAFALGPGDRSLHFASVTFDVSVEEVFGALTSGAALVLRSDAWIAGARAFWAMCETHGVTVADLPTRFWQLLAAEPGVAIPPCVRLVVIGGEAVEAGAVFAWFAREGHRPRLLNAYGPTETTVNATLREMTDDASAWRCIGRPMGSNRVYVLDAHGLPVPPGVAGEMHVGGGQVARGYLGRPALTAERFVPDPFAGEPGARMYRTGDRARWRPDGTLEFLGRDDHQVKLRGFRIELGEIEARLAAHPGIRGAVVALRGDAPGDRRLVAYYVSAGEEVAAEALRSHLSATLPEPMVPAAYVRLAALPLTPSGKVDRRALPAPEGDAFGARGHEPPVGETETAVAEIWAEVLNVAGVGRRDHFFERGGHSLLAVQVVSRVRRALGVEAALGDVFQRPVLADFARGLETAARADLPAIEPADRGGRLALSFAQQRLWFLEQMGSGGRAYHLPARLGLAGELDRGALGRALDALVARHEALRTTFVAADGEPEQRIAPPAESRFALAHHDVSTHPTPRAELARVAAEEAEAPFDLARGPLVRGRLVRLAADDHVLLVTMHHVVSDGWSMEVLVHELGVLYRAFRGGEPDPLPPLPVQYADYAAWQRRWVAGEVLRRQADYWRETLRGAPELLALPTDRPRPARQDFAGAFASLELDEGLTASLRALGRRNGTTLYMTLLAGWAAILARLSGQPEVVIGTPTANRGRAEVEGLIGFFVNTLALRLDLSGAPTVADLLARVKARTLEAQHHQDIPFEQVVELVQPARSLSHSPLFQVMFAWQAGPRGGREAPGLAQSAGAVTPHATATFDLSLTLGEVDGRIAGGVEYRTSLFDAATVARILGYLRRTLAEMAAGDARPVARLPMLPEEERRREVEAWNDTAVSLPPAPCMHALFEAQARRTPHAAAVAQGDASLSYGDLNARANRLARHLRGIGVGPDARVAICVDRGVEMIVSLLAVWKAGGAYVPLDPSYPADRLRFMLDDGAPAVLLTQASQRALVDSLVDANATPVVDLDGDARAWAGNAETDLDPSIVGLGPESLAYVIYTSGSTGRPKGVMVPHRGGANLVAAQAARLSLSPASRVLQFSSFSFDGFVFEVLMALAHGASLHLPPPGSVPVGDTLTEMVARHGITHAVLPPAVLGALREDARLDSVHTLLVVGDAPPGPLVRRWLPGRTVINGYGPTETTVCATLHACDAGHEGNPPLGGPITNTRIHLLDAYGEPVPAGTAGEMHVGGAGLARGYHGRPALTAERFVPDPFGGEPGARLYRTGDLARRLPDGTLEFLGRGDFQVKVRGYRIEPGEVEARLAAHPAVREAVVVAREDAPGDRRLVAYVVGPEPVDAESLRAHAAAGLPGHMVPAAYVWLEAWPLTPNGKLDRRALPAPEGDAFLARPYEAPEGETETALAGIWAEVLGVEAVGRGDNFFDLGGHSLRAVRLVARMREALGAEVALADVFAHPTVASLAAHLAGGAEPPADRAIPVRVAGTERPLFLVHEGTGSVAYAQVLHPHVDPAIPVYALPAAAPGEPLRTVEGMAARLVRMIRQVQPAGPYRLAGWSFGGVLAYETATRLLGEDEAVEFVGMIDTPYVSGAPAWAGSAAQEYGLLLRVLRMGEGMTEPPGPALARLADATGTMELEALVRRCHDEGLLPARVTAADALRMRDRARAFRAAMHAHVPRPIPIAIHVFPARDDADPDPRRGWQAVLPEGRIRATPVGGTHLTMMEGPHAAGLGAALSRALADAAAGRGETGSASHAADDAPLVTLRRGRAGRVPLFCIPGAGAGVGAFADLAACLEEGRPVHGLQPRGLTGGGVPHAGVGAAAAWYLRAVAEAQPAGPIHLLGHSFGGWVAFEMALRLRAAGRTVGSLTLLDSEVPDEDGDRIVECDAGEAFARLVEVFEQGAERPLGITPAELDGCDEDGRLRLLHARLVRAGHLPGRSDPAALAGTLRTFAACLRARYRPAGVYPGAARLVLVRDPRDDGDAHARRVAETVRGWTRWAPALVASAGAGNHVTALRAPHVRSLAALLADDGDG